MSNIISIRLEGFGHRNELIDISKASLNQEKVSSSDYWYDDDWQENAYLDSYDLISYSLPLYNENQKIIIEGDNVDEQIDNQTLDKIEVLDAVITKFMHDRFSDAGSENTPLILFQFSTKGIYHFDSLEIPDGEEFDIGRLTVETLIPIAPTQKPCVKRFLYEFADGTVKNLSFDGGEYSETPYEPDLITWFDIIEEYEDNLTKDQMLLQIFTQSAYDLEEQVFLACDNYFDEIEKVLEHRQCPPDLMNGIYDREINHWLEEKNDRDVLDILDCICDNPNSSKSLQKKVYQKQKELENKIKKTYGVIPRHWEDKHIIYFLLRNMMTQDMMISIGKISDTSIQSFQETGNKFQEAGIDMGSVRKDVDDYMLSLFNQDKEKFMQTVYDCEDYVKENFEENLKNKVWFAILNMAAADRVLEDIELKIIKRIAEKWSKDYDQILDSMLSHGVKINRIEDSVKRVQHETEKKQSQSIEKSSSPPIDPIESFREFMTGEFPGMKLPKNKNYGQCDISSGMLICFMAKKSSVSTYLYSSGKLPAKKVFEKINSLGLSGTVINDKYTLTPMTGSRNPNVVRIDIEIKYDGRDLNSAEMRAEVKDVYGQLLELCKPIV